MYKPRPGILVAVLGFCGLTFNFIESSGGMGSKIPITLFFLVIMIIGIVAEMIPPEKMNEFYGEGRGGREFG